MMTRVLLLGVVLVCATMPAYALTEQEVADQLSADLGAAAATLHGVVPAQQLSLTALLNLAGDKAQLDMNLALKDLSVSLAIASANLSTASAASAPTARQQYLSDVAQGVGKYQQSVARAYNAWLQRAAEVHQQSQQAGPQTVQSALQELATAQQRAAQSVSASDWGAARPAIAPTLPDLSQKIAGNDQRIADLQADLTDARMTYLADIADTMAASDRTLQTALALTDPSAMAEAMNEALAELKSLTCVRYQQYDAQVRTALGAATTGEPCGSN